MIRIILFLALVGLSGCKSETSNENFVEIKDIENSTYTITWDGKKYPIFKGKGIVYEIKIVKGETEKWNI